MKKCSICGKEYQKREIKVKDKVLYSLEVPVCDCEEKQRIRYEQIREEEQRKEKIEYKIRELKRTLNCPILTPFFENKTFSNFENLKAEESYKKNFLRCKEYAKDFKRGNKGLFMVGKVGTGKTTLQACIVKELEKRGFFCLLINFSTLLDLFIQSCTYEAKQSTFQLFNIISNFDYVVLDDIGREKYTDKRLEFAFRIVDTLMNNLVTLSITTNPECFNKLIKIEEYQAILDRLNFMCPEIMSFENKSFRVM